MNSRWPCQALCLGDRPHVLLAAVSDHALQPPESEDAKCTWPPSPSGCHTWQRRRDGVASVVIVQIGSVVPVFSDDIMLV